MGRGYTYIFERKPLSVLKTFFDALMFFFFLLRRSTPARVHALRPNEIQMTVLATYSHVRWARPSVLSGRVTRVFGVSVMLNTTARHYRTEDRSSRVQDGRRALIRFRPCLTNAAFIPCKHAETDGIIIIIIHTFIAHEHNGVVSAIDGLYNSFRSFCLFLFFSPLHSLAVNYAVVLRPIIAATTTSYSSVAFAKIARGRPCRIRRTAADADNRWISCCARVPSLYTHAVHGGGGDGTSSSSFFLLFS